MCQDFATYLNISIRIPGFRLYFRSKYFALEINKIRRLVMHTTEGLVWSLSEAKYLFLLSPRYLPFNVLLIILLEYNAPKFPYKLILKKQPNFYRTIYIIHVKKIVVLHFSSTSCDSSENLIFVSRSWHICFNQFYVLGSQETSNSSYTVLYYRLHISLNLRR